MIGVKKNVVVFFGLFLVGMLFVPTGIPFMVPEAEATHATAGSMIDTSIPSQYTISDDATGGDCTTIGTWNSGTKTCTLTGNVTVNDIHGIEIHSDGITLDGGGYVLTGVGGMGDQEEVGKGSALIYVYQQDNFTIKNFNLEGFSHGVRTVGTYDGVITGITGTGANRIDSKSDDGLQILNNAVTMHGTTTGIVVWNGDGNQNCSGSGAFVIKGNTLTSTQPSWQASSGIRSVITDGVCFDGNTVTGASHGIEVSGSASVYGGAGAVVTNNITNDNGSGISVGYDHHVLTMTGNTANNNLYRGFYVDGAATVATFTGNTATGNGIADFDGITQESGPPSGTVSTSGISLNGNDGGDCSTVGTWDSSTKTCTLTADISMTSNGVGIMISSQSWQNDPTETGLILDGNGHTITGTGTSGIDHDGVRITGSSSNITVKNLTITNFKNGINSNFTNGLTITGVTVSSVGSYGIYLYGTDSLTLENNTVTKSIVIYEHNAYMGHGNGSCTGTGLYVAPSISINGPIVLKNNTVTSGTITATPTGICYEGNTVDGVSFPVDTTPTAPFTIGNDGGDCQYIGTWEQSSKTCTLTYTSSSIIINTTGHGIIIDGHDITLDGSSNKIYGDGGEDDFGVDVRNSDNFTIKDLHIKEFGIGIRAGNSNGGIITSINLIDNSVDGLYAEYVTALKVTGNNISSNGRNGITLNGGSGSGCSGSGAFLVQSNWVAANTGNGIEAFNHSGICFDNNTANVNGYGFYILGSQDDIFTSNTAIENINTGFHFGNGAAPVTFTDNTASGNGLSDFEGITISNIDLYHELSLFQLKPLPDGATAFTPGNTDVYSRTYVKHTSTNIATNVDVDLLITKPDGSVWINQSVLDDASIGPGSDISSYFNQPLPENFPLGTYTITHTIDPDNDIAETDETNNVYTTTFEVVEAVTFSGDLYHELSLFQLKPLPDGATAFTPGNTDVYSRTYVKHTSTNIATNVDVDLLITKPDGSVWINQSVLDDASIGPGSDISSYFNQPLPENFPLGTYTITHTIDPDNDIAETDETNNVYTTTFEVVEAVTFSGDLYHELSLFQLKPLPDGATAFTPGNTDVYSRTYVKHTSTNIATNVDVDLLITKPDGSVWINQSVLDDASIGPGSDISSYFNQPLPENFPLGTYTITHTIDPDNDIAETDETNNVYTTTFEVVSGAPIITVPDNISSSSISESGTAVTFDVTATFIIDAASGPTCDPASGSTFSIGTTTVTCTASDTAGNTATETFTVTLVYSPLDNEAPTITVPSTITLTTSNVAGAAATFSISATDNVAVTTGPACGVASGSNFAIGDTIVTCTASDAEGNTATETFTVTVQLASPPTINIQYDTISYNVNTGVFSSPVYYPQPTASSSLGIASGPTCTPSSNSQFSVGTTIVSCTATDSHGTAGTSSFSVVVSQQSALSDSACQTAAGSEHDSDSLFVCEFPFNVTVEENQILVWVDTQPWQGFYRHSITSSTGLFDHYDAGMMSFLPSAWGGVGTYSFYDKVNTSLTGSITIAESDNTNPTVTVPSDMTVSTDTPTGTPTITYSVSASDDREVTSGPTCTPASGTNFSVGTTTVTCSASDAAGNTGTSSFTVTVEYTFVDETAPGLVPPSGITLATTNPTGIIVTYTGVTATDNVAVTSGPTCTPASGTMFPIGITEVTCTASDEAGNEGSTSFTVTITQTIIDSSAPAITTSNNISQTTTSSSGKIVNYQVPTAVDNVGVTIGPTCTPASGYLFSVGITTVTCSASDAAGNTATAIFTVTITNTAAVGDTIPPTLSQLGNIVQDMTLSNGAIVAYNLPTATDDTAVTFGPYCTPSSSSLFSIGTTTVTCIAKDAAGNQGSVSFSVIVTQPIAGEDNTLTLQLDTSSYFTGDPINITGVATGDTVDVTLVVEAPNGDLISVSQVTPESGTVSQPSGTQVTVKNAPGSSFEGCEPNCFLPSTVSIDAGETVIWENPDNVPHTVTSGSPFGGPDGYFDSGLISVGSSFSSQFNASGTYDYYCIVHPWMQGSVFVSGSSSAQPEEGGSFATEILTIGPLWSQDGSYTVKASYGPATATKTFNFTVRELDAVPFTSVPSNIALSINKSDYTGDETISINVALIGGSASQPINIEVSDPVGTALFLQTVNTDSQARVSSQFTLPENVVSGTYTVSASSSGELWDLTDSVAFTGIPLEPEVLDSSISVTNEQGAAVTTYNAGDLGYFSTKMTTKSTSQILVTVSVLDAQQNTLGVGFFKTVLPKGDAEIVLGFEIPEGTISGDAQVFTNFFTDWPDQGGISIGEEVSSKVNIIGVEPVEEVVEVLEEPVQMQVTVQNAPGSSYPGCEETNSCFLPFVAEIDIDGTVTWENVDAFAHTVTSGTPESGLDGHFDSGLIMVGQSYSNTFDTAGTYDYFCMVHPWMQGQVVVGGSDEVVEPIIEPTPVFDPESVVIPESTSEHGIVVNAPGSSTPGCEETNSCFLPSTVIIDLGGTVTWENTDTAAHTATAGTPQDGPSGHFDSSLIMTGGSYSVTLDDPGIYDYFCMVHPWMQGQVVVGDSEAVVEPVIEEEPIPESSGMQATVQNAPGSSFEGCEPDCFLPSTVIIDLGGTVTWENPDNVPHTMTSGTSADGPSGHFDSSLITAGGSFSNTFDESGIYDYFCMIHPWMTGTVIVGFEEVAAEVAAEAAAEVASSGMQATVQNALGSSFQGCEPCFLPSTVTIDLGGTVTWENPDNAAHSTASFIGSISGVVGLEWDSGLMLKDQSFSHTFDTEGTYDYFCMVHPWMQGQVIVQGEEEEPPPPVQEEIIEVVDILALNGTSNIIFLTGTDYVEANKSSLNDEHEKLTVSSWVKPDFISTSTQQYSAVSKEGSFELFLTNTKEPKHVPGFSVFDGQSWNTILIDSKVTEGWHHLAGVVNGEDISLYLDSVLIGTKSIPSQTGYMAASENAITVGTLINSVSMPIEILNSFQGSISEVNIITDALTSEQISNLYLTDKDMFQRDFVEVESVINGTVTTTLVTTESPELSADECIELAKERGLYDQVGGSEAYTLVCQFPFDVIIPINSRVLWMETLSLENAPYHSIQSVDNLFSTGSMTSADMGFYDDTFTYGIYEYYDNFAESLTGKITISKLTNSININEGSASPECADTNLCYDTFAAQIDVGEEVTWRNMDILTHSVTSGTPGDGPDGLFDSGLFSTYLYFSYTFEEAGTYDYYCTTHPWMQGKVVVGEV